MHSHRVFAKLIELHDLPTLPQIVHKIVEAVDDERSSAADVTALLEKDHAISARVLRLANSAFYGLRDPVDSIRRAVVVLGFDAVSQLALATSVFKTFSNQRQFALDPEDFWMHAFGTAKAAQLICHNHVKVASPEGCFTAGLLHDVGKYLLALVLRDEYHTVVSEAAEKKAPLQEYEKERLGISHAEVGRWLAAKWRFPNLIIEVIGNMHRPVTSKKKYAKEIAVVQLADTLSSLAKFGTAGDWQVPRVDARLLTFLGMKQEDAESVMDELVQVRAETRKFLEVMDSD
ncbi:MAG: HDOD domain-containing protein [Candidatus Hydrogenedentota bacterium]